MSVLPGDGRVVEAHVEHCPTCAASWPRKAGHVRVGWEPCSGCPGSAYGGHRCLTCLRCGVEHRDGPCVKLGGARTVQRLEVKGGRADRGANGPAAGGHAARE